MFGVPAGKLLGYMVSARGIEANPEKVQAIAKMQEPTNIKGVQLLTGRLAALSRFISRLVLGFGVENKKNRHYETKPKNGTRKMQTRISILLPFATVQRMHSRSGRC